jgi:hypothetical protein
MKQVVISTGWRQYGELLTPYWTAKYLKRKGIEVFVYNQEVGLEDKWEYELIKDVETLKYSIEMDCVSYSAKNIGEFLNEEEWDKINMFKNNIIEYDKLFLNREDEDLIFVANEIKNEETIKVIDIPNDVKYKICNSRFREWIEEDIEVRKWK